MSRCIFEIASMKMWFLYYKKRSLGYSSTGSLRNKDDVNENGKTAIGLVGNISLPSLLYYDVELPNSTFCGGRKHKATTFFFFSWTSIVFQNSTPQQIASIWRNDRDGISAIKFGAERHNFLSDVFVAVAVALTPYSRLGTRSRDRCYKKKKHVF